MDKEKEKPQEEQKEVKRWKAKKKFKPWERSKELRDMKTLVALLNSPTVKDAYMKLHPKASEATAEVSGSGLVTEEIIDKIKKMLAIDPNIKTTRVTIERFLYYILGQYMAKQIRPTEALRALELLSKLVPDFKERMEVEDLSQLGEDEINKRLGSFADRFKINLGDFNREIPRS